MWWIADANSDTYAHSDTYTNAHADSYADADTHTNTHADAYSNADTNTYANTHADAYTDAHAYTDADTDSRNKRCAGSQWGRGFGFVNLQFRLRRSWCKQWGSQRYWLGRWFGRLG